MFSPNILVFGGGDAGMSHQLTTGKAGSLTYVCTVQYLHQEAKGGPVEQQEIVSLPHQAIRESSDVDNIHHLICFSATPWIIFRSCGRLTTGAKVREKD